MQDSNSTANSDISNISTSSKHFNTISLGIKTLIFVLALILGFFLFVHFSPTIVHAAPAAATGQPIQVCEKLGGCLGGIDKFKSAAGATPESITKQIYNFVLMLVKIAIYLASVVSVVFIVFSGYKYITSQGDETATKSALKTLTSACIGLALAICSLTIVTFIGSFLTNFSF
jgi:Type IV secretion system pilin